MFTSGKFPNNVVSFCDKIKLCTASVLSEAEVIDCSPFLSLLGSYEQIMTITQDDWRWEKHDEHKKMIWAIHCKNWNNEVPS